MSAVWPRMALWAASTVLVMCTAAQTSSSTVGNSSTSGSMGNAHSYDRPDLISSYDPNLSHRQFLARRQEAHNRMLNNATKLLALARELQESIRLHEPTAGDARSMDDIAKLARAVRDGMRQ